MDRQLKLEVVKQINVTKKLLAIAALLEEAGLKFAVLKGAHLAYAYYDHPEERFFSDMDLLISPADRELAVEVLKKHFALRFYYPFTKERPFSHYNHTIAIDGCELDLHFDFSPYKRYYADIKEFLANTEPFYIAGQRLLGLTPEYLLANLALHALKGYYEITIKHLKDVAIVIKKRQLDFDKLYKLLASAGATYGSYYYFGAASSVAGAQIPAEFMAKLRPPFWRRALLSHFMDASELPILCRHFSQSELHIAISPLIQDSKLRWLNSVICYLRHHKSH